MGIRLGGFKSEPVPLSCSSLTPRAHGSASLLVVSVEFPLLGISYRWSYVLLSSDGVCLTGASYMSALPYCTVSHHRTRPETCELITRCWTQHGFPPFGYDK